MKIGELSGSLTNLLDGTSYLIAGTNVTIVSESNGAITISSTGGGGPVGDQFFFSSTTGSIYSSGSLALIGGADEWGVIGSPADKGTDVFFYVSGSVGSKNGQTPGVALFGGDFVVSGSVFAEGNRMEITGTLEVTNGISGSLTKLSDGTSYLIAGKNIGIISQSNGSIIISSSTPTLVYRPGGVDTDNVYSSWSSLMSAFSQLEGVVTIDVDTNVASPATVPVGTYDLESRAIIRGTQTGAVYPSQLQLADGVVIKNPREFENIWLDLQATSTPNFVFDVDDRTVKITGVSYVEMNGTQPFADITAALSLGIFFAIKNDVIINNYATSNRNFLSINNAGASVIINVTDNIVLNNDNFIAGTAGSLYVYHDSSLSVSFTNRLPTNPNFSGTTVITPLDNAKLVSYDDLFAGTTELSASTVQVAIDVLKNRWSSSVSDHLFTTSSIAIKGNESGIDQASAKGTDVFFYVSGSQGSKDGVTPGVALFGGDVVISGTLHGGSPLKVSGSMHISGSFSQGTNSQATGIDSHAEGEGSAAMGSYSHAEGYYTTATGSYSHAEGEYTKAYGIASHAEGSLTVAGCLGYIGSISAGLITLDSSYGDVSAEFGGYIIVNDQDYSNTYTHKVFEMASVAFNSPSTEITLVDSSITTATAIIGIEGSNEPTLANYVIGNASHAEGGGSIAQGIRAHSEGGSVASGHYSHAESEGYASGYASHAEGLGKARGLISHAEGWNTEAHGQASHAEGFLSVARGDYSHAGGEGTIASGSAQTVIGKYNLRDNDFSLFVVGNGDADVDTNRSDVFRINPGTLGNGRVEVTGSFGVSGSTDISGSLWSTKVTAEQGFSGSLTKLVDGTSYLVAGNNITITSQSNGQVTISSAGGGGLVVGVVDFCSDDLSSILAGYYILSVIVLYQDENKCERYLGWSN